MKDAIDHYKEIIAQIQNITFSSFYTIKIEEIKELIKKKFKNICE